MRVTNGIVAFLPVINAAFVPADTSATDELARKALDNVRLRASRQHPKTYDEPPTSLLSRLGQRLGLHTSSFQSSDQPSSENEQPQCTLATASVRREWDTLSPPEKKAYISAVLCMMHKPPISGDLVPGARSRFDDFFGTHVNQTLHIHGTGSFLSWHRYFTWTYEQALRQECGYTGTFPYFNWGRYALDLYNAPIFDGSDTSLSGNGCHEPRNNGTNIPSNATPFITLPPGEGGGCVTTGPFANYTVNLGPMAPVLSFIKPNPSPDGLGYNPRCFRRDIGAYPAKIWSKDSDCYALITQSPHIGAFQTTMQGDFAAGFLGIHTSGHFFTGGDPGGDLFSSVGDPFFYLQHAQIDRVWWIWQNYLPDAAEDNGIEGKEGDRIFVIGNTTTVNNTPPSRNATLDDIIQLGVNDLNGLKGIRIRDAVDTLAGPFCYIYE